MLAEGRQVGRGAGWQPVDQQWSARCSRPWAGRVPLDPVVGERGDVEPVEGDGVEGPPGPASVLHPDGSTADDVVQGVAVEVAGDAVVVAHCAQPSPGPSDAAACRSAPTPAASARHRTARLVLTGEQVDAATAHRWGLVDALNAVEDP